MPGPMTFVGQALIIFFGVSELGLLLFKRSGGTMQKADRQSLRWLWPGIGLCVFFAISVGYSRSLGHSQAMESLFWPGAALLLSGLVLRWYAILYLGKFFTVDVAIASDHRVIDSGPYRYIRHPSYAGVLLAFLGFGVILANGLSLLLLTLPILLMLWRRIVIEEAALTAALGDSYQRYREHTRALIPWIW